GTADQKEYMHKIITGEEIWCQGYSEPNAGSDLAAIQTTAVKDKDGWKINGQKTWTSFGHDADKCFLLYRSSTHTENKHRRITSYCIDIVQPVIEKVTNYTKYTT